MSGLQESAIVLVEFSQFHRLVLCRILHTRVQIIARASSESDSPHTKAVNAQYSGLKPNSDI